MRRFCFSASRLPSLPQSWQRPRRPWVTRSAAERHDLRVRPAYRTIGTPTSLPNRGPSTRSTCFPTVRRAAVPTPLQGIPATTVDAGRSCTLGITSQLTNAEAVVDAASSIVDTGTRFVCPLIRPSQNRLQEDARRRLERAVQGDEPARLRQVDVRVVRHDRGARQIEAKTDELVEAPDTRPLFLVGQIELGRQLDLVGPSTSVS